MGWGKIPAFLKMLAHMEPLHEQLVPEPHYYLFVLGVNPSRQRHGLGSQLLEPAYRSAIARASGLTSTTREENLEFYARHGFRIVQTVERAGWLKFWLMTRSVSMRACTLSYTGVQPVVPSPSSAHACWKGRNGACAKRRAAGLPFR
jgi:hypothetical protein